MIKGRKKTARRRGGPAGLLVWAFLALAACETTEQRAARESQFNGKALAD